MGLCITGAFPWRCHMDPAMFDYCRMAISNMRSRGPPPSLWATGPDYLATQDMVCSASRVAWLHTLWDV